MDSALNIIVTGLILLLAWSLYRSRRKATQLSSRYRQLDTKLESLNQELKTERLERRQAEVVLKASELRNRLIIYSAQITVWEWDLSGDKMVWNENLTELFGHPLGDTENSKQWWLENIHPDDRSRVTRSIDEYLMLGEGVWREEYRFKQFDSGWSCVSHWGLVIADEAGKAIRMVGAMLDITARKQAEERLQQSELNLLEAQRIAHLGSWAWNIESGVLEWSREQQKLFGYTPNSATPVYEDFIDAIYPDDKKEVLKAIDIAMDRGTISDLEFRISRPDGSVRWISMQGEVINDAAGNPNKMVGTSMDITERKSLEEKLKFQAIHDQLTGLYNRRVLEERLNDEVDRANRYDHPLTVFMLDIDHFKSINDNYGHSAGDIVLHALAVILENTTRKTDVLARYGGEEFVVILPETSLETALKLGEQLREEISRQSIEIDNQMRIRVTASIGIASFPDHTESPHSLLGIADKALYEAKRNGRNRVASPVPAKNSVSMVDTAS